MARTLPVVTVLLVLPLLAAACGEAPAAKEVKPVAVINLTVGPESAHRCAMGLQLAGHFLADGRETIVFLNVAAPVLASKKLAADTVFSDNPPFKAMLADLIEKGARILVCPACAKALTVAEGDLVEGTAFATRESLFGPLDDSAVVFSY